MIRVLGIDLAWGEGTAEKPPNETGVVAVECDGRIVDAGWTLGPHETAAWMQRWSTSDGTFAFVDASLIVENERGARECEAAVARHYGRWKVAANVTNLAVPWQAGVTLRTLLEADGWTYHDGCDGPPRQPGRYVSECYPYTTLVGAAEFGYDVERPRYKRKPKTMSAAEFRPLRAAACDDLIARIGALASADPAIDVLSHPVTARLLDEPSPIDDRAYKHREDLIDAIVAAWTGLLWLAHGFDRCQVLGRVDDAGSHRHATIVAPWRRYGAR